MSAPRKVRWTPCVLAITCLCVIAVGPKLFELIVMILERNSVR